MSRPRKQGIEELCVQFVSDEDVLEHIIDKQEVGVTRSQNHENKTAINVKTFLKKNENNLQDVDEDVLTEQDYVAFLATDVEDLHKAGPVITGGDVYSFHAVKRSHKMAQLATELARTPGKSVTFNTADSSTEAVTSPRSGKKHATSNKTPSKSKKNEFVSTTPHRLRKRLTAPTLRSESESDYSASDSEGESSEEKDEAITENKTPNKASATPAPSTPPATPVSSKTPSKQTKQAASAHQVEEYFEAHSSKVLTSDRTLQRLQTPKLDQETLRNLLENATPAFSEELKHLNQKHEELFYKWMLQLHLGFNIILFGLGSKRNLLEKFRTTLLQDSAHIVINGFFPSITVKSILNSITEEVLDHLGTFRNPTDQLDFILREFRKGTSMDMYLIIHNIDSQMLRGDKIQQVIGQLASAPNIHLIASIDHINAPLMWDQSKQSLYNWLWYETTTYSPYLEETSYENSLLVKQSGALALSSLTHVLRSLTPNARGIFRLLAEYQLTNKDNSSFPGLSFQDFYQQCREAFLVNSDLTLRAQLTEFKDHKLIRTKKGADGVEYLSIPVDHGTLTDFLEKEDNEV